MEILDIPSKRCPNNNSQSTLLEKKIIQKKEFIYYCIKLISN